jgi:hypothetical protein
MSGELTGVISRPAVDDLFRNLLTETPAWTRLEPLSASGDPTPGLEARVFDPLWLLSRQWRLGEFEGEDAGSPLFVEVSGVAHNAVAWQPGATGGERPFRPLPPEVPLDPQVERELPAPRTLGVRQRAEAGADLVDQFREAGVDPGDLLSACAFEGNDIRNALPAALRCAFDAMPDGLRAAEAVEAAAPGLPPWLAGAPTALLDGVAGWLRWFRENVAPSGVREDDCWIPERLEYRFAVETGAPAHSTVLRAPVHTGGEIDWFSFDIDGSATANPPGLGSEADSTEFALKVFATSLTYAGMPSDRYWEFEDGQMNFGQLDAQPHDLARLCLAEFALIYGNDWLAVPVDVPSATFCQLTTVRYVDTFGIAHDVPRASDEFRLFEIARDDGGRSVPALFIPPSVLNTLEGDALEDVQFVRDETANLVWAIERAVQGPSGDPRSRQSDRREEHVARTAAELAGADFDYLFATTVPPNWIPFVPVQDGIGSFHLRKGTMAPNGEDLSQGAIVAATPYDLMDEEVPREGVRVRRLPCLARAADGRYLRWIARRIGVGKGEAASGLQYDSAVRPRQ